MQTRKNFIKKNEAFKCEKCELNVSPADSTSRNHCPNCLTSKHVDQHVPGDRAATCGGLMPTINYEGTDPDKLKLVQQCQKCHKIHRNKTAPDDIRSYQLLVTSY